MKELLARLKEAARRASGPKVITLRPMDGNELADALDAIVLKRHHKEQAKAHADKLYQQQCKAEMDRSGVI